MRPRILIIDDEELVCNLLKSEIERHLRAIVFTAHQGKEMPSVPHANEISVLVVDPRAFGGRAMIFMEKARAADPLIKILVISGNHNKNEILRMFREGVSDYFEKPLHAEEVNRMIKKCLEQHDAEQVAKSQMSRLSGRVNRVEGQNAASFWFVSKARSMETVNECLTGLRREALRGGGEESSVMIFGNPGAAQEGIARMIHMGSRRARGPWISVNCGQLTEDQMDAEFFGYDKGLQNGIHDFKLGVLELAEGGTLYLEGVENLSLDLQAKILHTLDTKILRRIGGAADITFDARMVTMGNENLRTSLKEGQFNEVFYRYLSRIVMEIPALKERKEDIVPMAEAFAERCFTARGKTFEGFSRGFEKELMTYSWPGDVLELFNLMNRVALLKSGEGEVGVEYFWTGGVSRAIEETHTNTQSRKLQLVSSAAGFHEFKDADMNFTKLKKRWSDSFEKDYLIELLKKNEGNVSAAARDARLDRSNLLRLMRRHGIKSKEYRGQEAESFREVA